MLMRNSSRDSDCPTPVEVYSVCKLVSVFDWDKWSPQRIRPWAAGWSRIGPMDPWNGFTRVKKLQNYLSGKGVSLLTHGRSSLVRQWSHNLQISWNICSPRLPPQRNRSNSDLHKARSPTACYKLNTCWNSLICQSRILVIFRSPTPTYHVLLQRQSTRGEVRKGSWRGEEWRRIYLPRSDGRDEPIPMVKKHGH